VRRHRLSRPHGAQFLRGAIADGDDELEWRHVRFRELVPALAAQILDRQVILSEHIQR